MISEPAQSAAAVLLAQTPALNEGGEGGGAAVPMAEPQAALAAAAPPLSQTPALNEGGEPEADTPESATMAPSAATVAAEASPPAPAHEAAEAGDAHEPPPPAASDLPLSQTPALNEGSEAVDASTTDADDATAAATNMPGAGDPTVANNPAADNPVAADLAAADTTAADPAAADTTAADTTATGKLPPAIPDLPPAATAELLAQHFPALFGAGRALPIKLRIQADIQQRLPGVFNKKSLSIFLHRATTSTAYLRALANAPQRLDLDGAPAGEIANEHRQAAAAELERRRVIVEARRQAERAAQRDAQRSERRNAASSPAADGAPGAGPVADGTAGPAQPPHHPPQHPQQHLPPQPPSQHRLRPPGQPRGDRPPRPADGAQGQRPPRPAGQDRQQRPGPRPDRQGPGGPHADRQPSRPDVAGGEDRRPQRDQQPTPDRRPPRPPLAADTAASAAPMAVADPASRERAALLRQFEGSTLTKSNFCALKGLREADLDAQLALARQDRQQRGGGAEPAQQASRSAGHQAPHQAPHQPGRPAFKRPR